MIESDEDLMMRVKEGKDELAFESLVQRHRKPLLNFVYRFVDSDNKLQLEKMKVQKQS